MRTKALLGLAAIAASALTAAAQSNVYSLNVVGYYNIPLGVNQKLMIANQLNTTNNTLGAVIPTPPQASQFFKYSGGFTAYLYDLDDNNNLNWQPDGNATLNPGEGGFFQSPTATTLTFVGEVMQGSLVNTLPANIKVIRSSMVPQSGGVSSVLGLPADQADNLFTYAGGYTAYLYDLDDNNNLVWQPSEPSPAVGQAFFYKKAATGTHTSWVRNFTVQ
jgi:hypothetical protein